MDSRVLRSIVKFGVAALTVMTLLLQANAQIKVNNAPPRRVVDPPQKPKTVHGVVQDMRGVPLVGAQVLIRDTKKNTTRTATTDAKGEYAVYGLPPEVDYEVTAQFKGQQSAEKKLVSSLLKREDNVLSFQLNVTVIAGTAPALNTASDKEARPQLNTFDLVQLHASFEMPIGLSAPIPAVLLLHGYGEDRSVWEDFRKQLITRGWAVMSLDLRGHGESKTKNQFPITASTDWRTSSHEFPLDLDPALDWLKSQPRLDSHKIAIIGYDVGANLALIASGRFPEVRTVIAIKPNLAESLAMAGSAQDFTPRSALLIVADAAEGVRIQSTVQAPVQVKTVAMPGGTSQSLQNKVIADATFQWLKDTY